jgi:hypothetical protein
MLRNDFAGCSTGSSPNSYYKTKGHAVSSFESVLTDHGLQFDPVNMIDMPGDDGRTTIDVYTDELECAGHVGCAVLTWHKMEVSGRWEFIGYLT